jgi:hypothetical protein
MYRVWFDFGSGVEVFEEKTLEELNAFIAGVCAACASLRIDDYRQFNSEEEVANYLRDCAAFDSGSIDDYR